MECYLHYRQLNLKYISEGYFPGFWNWKPVCYIASFLGSVRQPFRLETAWIVPRAVGLLPMENIPRGVSVPWLHLQPLRAQVLMVPWPSQHRAQPWHLKVLRSHKKSCLLGSGSRKAPFGVGLWDINHAPTQTFVFHCPDLLLWASCTCRDGVLRAVPVKGECFCCLLHWQPEENPWLWQVAEQSFGNRMNCCSLWAARRCHGILWGFGTVRVPDCPATEKNFQEDF